MKPNDETIYQAQGQVEEKKKDSAKGSWQKVTIGGVTGILMGAGTMYVGNAYATEEAVASDENNSASQPATSHTAENGLRVAEVDQNLSFGEAFAAARAEVGAGGVFHWHGRTYNTYTESEWENMSDAEHNQFAQQVAPEIQTNEIPPEHHHSTAQHYEAHHEQQEDASQQPQVRQVSGDREEQEEPEVHFLGVDQVQTNSGQTMNVGHMTIAEEEVALVDMDNDMIFDVAVSDRNHNDQIDEGEVIDISDRQLTVTDFALAAEQENGNVESAQPEMVNNPQDQLAEDMPDYMNDVDIQTT